MKKIVREFLVKNAVVVLLLALIYFPLSSQLAGSTLAEDKVSAGNILLATSIVAVIACFGCFAFTYEKVDSGGGSPTGCSGTSPRASFCSLSGFR